jgi:hypothetical protein
MAIPNAFASGTKTPTVGTTPDLLSNVNIAGSFVLVVDTNAIPSKPPRLVRSRAKNPIRKRRRDHRLERRRDRPVVEMGDFFGFNGSSGRSRRRAGRPRGR